MKYMILTLQLEASVRVMAQDFAKKHDLKVIELEPNSEFSVGSLNFVPKINYKVNQKGVSFLTGKEKGSLINVQGSLDCHFFASPVITKEHLEHGQGPVVVEDEGNGKFIWRHLMYDGKQLKDSYLK